MKRWILTVIVFLSFALPGLAVEWDRQSHYDCIDGRSRYMCTYSEKRECQPAMKKTICNTTNSACEFKITGTAVNDDLGDLRDTKACREACARQVEEGECANPSKWK